MRRDAGIFFFSSCSSPLCGNCCCLQEHRNHYADEEQETRLYDISNRIEIWHFFWVRRRSRSIQYNDDDDDSRSMRSIWSTWIYICFVFFLSIFHLYFAMEFFPNFGPENEFCLLFSYLVFSYLYLILSMLLLLLFVFRIKALLYCEIDARLACRQFMTAEGIKLW